MMTLDEADNAFAMMLARTIWGEIASIGGWYSNPNHIIIHPDVYWRIRFAPYGNPKQRARLSAQVPRHRLQRRRTLATARQQQHKPQTPINTPPGKQ